METNQSGGRTEHSPSSWVTLTADFNYRAANIKLHSTVKQVLPSMCPLHRRECFRSRQRRRRHSAVATAALADQWLRGSACCDSAGSTSHLNPPANTAQVPSGGEKIWISARVDLAGAATMSRWNWWRCTFIRRKIMGLIFLYLSTVWFEG